MKTPSSILGRDPRVALIHPGIQYAPQLAEQLARVGLLSAFWTGVAASDRGWLGPWLRPGATNRLARFLGRRVIRGVEPRQIRLRPWPEVLAGCQLRLGLEEQKLWHRRNEVFQRALPAAVFRQNDLLVGFDTSGWILAERCAGYNRPFVLDQSIGHPNAKVAIYESVRRAFPGWAHELEYRRPEILAAENTEHRLASRIVAASSFTKRTLVAHGVAAEKIVVNPYGVDLQGFTPAAAGRANGRPLRFVFVGHVGARKGIPLLLEVWSRLAPVNCELWLIGYVAPRTLPLVSGLRGVVIKGNVSHRDLPGLLRECDVFVFPSYFEGFALVLLEAMACGLPVIATDATAAPDILTDGRDGYVIPAGDAGALADRMSRFIRDAGSKVTMGGAARRTAERFGWAAYGDRWRRMIEEMFAAESTPAPGATRKRLEPGEPVRGGN